MFGLAAKVCFPLQTLYSAGMKRRVTKAALQRFMEELAQAARSPAIDPAQFKKKVEDFLGSTDEHN